MSKECKLTDKTLDAAFVRVDSIEESIKFENRGLITGCDIFPPTAYPNLTRVVKVRVGNQVAEFENTTLTVVNPKCFAEEAQQQAWDIARRIYLCKENGGLSLTEHYEIFGDNCSIGDIYRMPFKEVAAKIEAWENQIKAGIKAGIQVGDEVKPKCCEAPLIVVTAVTPGNTGDFICGIQLETGRTIRNERADNHVKTGRKFKINEGFFEEIKE